MIPRILMPRRIALTVVLVVVSALFPEFTAQADVRILSSPGGAVDAYLAAFARVRQSGERVVIDGPCLSACTLVLSTIPRNRICVTRRAVLGFHAPRWYYPGTGQTMRASEATRAVTASYPPGVRAWIKKRGGLTQKVRLFIHVVSSVQTQLLLLGVRIRLQGVNRLSALGQ